MSRHGMAKSPDARKNLLYWEGFCRLAVARAKRAGFTIATLDELIGYKTSDTLFVLGSSPSINNITDAGWGEIGRHDSIGFNYFLAHPFVPTYYHLELLPNHRRMFYDCYSQRRDAYKNVPFMVNYLHIDGEITRADLEFVHNLTVTVPRRYAGTTEDDFRRILEYAYRRIEPRDNGYLVHNRASISLMVSLAVLLGYKRVVLVGIDLNSVGYFYCDERYACDATRELLESRCRADENVISEGQAVLHITADPALWPEHITIDRTLAVMKEAVLTTRGMELYVYDNKTLLYPAFPVWTRS